MAAYSGCGERDGGIGHGKRRSRTGLARVCGDVGLAGGSVADGRRQAGSGMARSRARAQPELLLPGPALGKMQGDPACRAGEPSGQGEDPPPEGLGGHDRAHPGRCGLSAEPGCGPSPVPPARRRWRQSGPRGAWFSPTPYLRSRIAFSISAWRRWSASSSRVSPSRSVMKPVIAVGGEESQLRTGQPASPAGRWPYRLCGIRLTLDRGCRWFRPHRAETSIQ